MVTCSIITINRNNASGLLKTIESVVSQTSKDYEFIIIDGSSSDDSIEQIKKFQDKISFWVSEPDKGVYNAMNKGIQKSTGLYCLFLNSGDFLFEPATLEKVFARINGEDIVYGNIIYEGDNEPIVFPSNVTLQTFLGTSIGHAGTFIKRELFDKYGLYNEQNKIVSDWEFFIKAFLKYKCSYKYIDQTISVYQKGGISNKPSNYMLLVDERYKVLQNEFPELYDTILENEALKKQLGYYTTSRIVQFIKKVQNSKLYKLTNRRSG